MANLIELLWDLVERPATRDAYRDDPPGWLSEQGHGEITGEDVAATLEVVRDLVEPDAADRLAEVAPGPRDATPTADETPQDAAQRLLDVVVDAVDDLPEAPPRPDPVGPVTGDPQPLRPVATPLVDARDAVQTTGPAAEASTPLASVPSQPVSPEPVPIALGTDSASDRGATTDDADTDHPDPDADTSTGTGTDADPDAEPAAAESGRYAMSFAADASEPPPGGDADRSPHLAPVPGEPGGSDHQAFVPLSFGSSSGLTAVPDADPEQSDEASADTDDGASPFATKSSGLKLPTIGVQATDWMRDEGADDDED